MTRRATTLIALLACAALGVLAAGCGGSSSGSGVAQLGSTSAAAPAAQATTPASPQDAQEAILAFVRCLRDEGIDIPDPDFSQGGGARLQLRRGGLDPSSPKLQKAREKCQPLIASIRSQFSPERREQLQQAAVDFAKCMRENGIDVPDPDFSGNGGPGGMGGLLRGATGIDPNDPKVQKAMDACRHVFTDAGLGQGPGGRGPVPTRP